MYSYEELAGNADYVMIGKVVDELGVDYKWPVMKENEDGTPVSYTHLDVYKRQMAHRQN